MPWEQESRHDTASNSLGVGEHALHVKGELVSHLTGPQHSEGDAGSIVKAGELTLPLTVLAHSTVVQVVA